MNKEMNWGTFVPTREIRENDRKLRESASVGTYCYKQC